MLLIPARKSYYEILEVSEDATEVEIKRAFKRLARKFHPDMFANSTDPLEKARAETEMKRINRAKEILLNTQLRMEYDKKIKKMVVEVDWGSDFMVDSDWFGSSTNDTTTSTSENRSIDHEFEIDWEQDMDKDNGNEYDNSYQNDYDQSNIIHSPPPRYQTESDQYRYQPFPRYKSQPNSMAIEVAPGVLFLQKCIKCGKINIEGIPYCQGCNSSLIYDNHPYFYNQMGPDSDLDTTKPVPIKPGQKPDDGQGILVISKCFRCGSENTNNSPHCLKCRSSLVYYKRPLPMDRLKNLGKNRIYTDHQSEGTNECPRCGAQNQVGRQFCYSCFANLASLSQPPPADYKELYIDANANKFGVGVNDNGYKNCPNCGELNLATREFCQKCNIRLLFDQPPITIDGKNMGVMTPNMVISTTIDCPHCGAENSVDDEICVSCYQNLKVQETRKSPPKPRSDLRLSEAEQRVKYYGYKPCPKCRCENDFRAEFCRDCGYEFHNY